MPNFTPRKDRASFAVHALDRTWEARTILLGRSPWEPGAVESFKRHASLRRDAGILRDLAPIGAGGMG